MKNVPQRGFEQFKVKIHSSVIDDLDEEYPVRFSQAQQVDFTA